MSAAQVSDGLAEFMLLPEVDPLLHWLAVTSLALLFAGAAYGKLRDLTGFRYVLDAYDLLPSSLTGGVAVGLALTELALTITLCVPATFFGSASSIAAWLAIGLLALYTAAICVNLLRGRVEMNCGCMGAGSNTGVLSRWLVVRNLLVMSLAALILLPATLRSLVWVDGVTLLFGLAALALVYRLGDQLIANSTFQNRWQNDHD